MNETSGKRVLNNISVNFIHGYVHSWLAEADR